jgi:hypothetical protein
MNFATVSEDTPPPPTPPRIPDQRFIQKILVSATGAFKNLSIGLTITASVVTGLLHNKLKNVKSAPTKSHADVPLIVGQNVTERHFIVFLPIFDQYSS